MTMSPSTNLNEPSRAIARRIAPIILLIIAVAIRFPYWPIHRDLGDSLNYSIGALVTHVAHPPGSVGYCVLLGWINALFHNIKFTIILVSYAACLSAIVVCYQIARSMRLSAFTAMAAVVFYAFSINTLKASLLGGPHMLEGLCSLVFGWFVWRAVQQKQLTDALLATFVFAIAGAIRPTTTMLLFPLWVFMLWQTRRGLVPMFIQLLIVIPIIAAWNWGNSHYMTLAGYGGTTYQDQVLTGSAYDFDSMSSTLPINNSAGQQLTFHMPGAELLAWFEVKTGLRLMPHVPDWPKPSVARACRLIVMQTLKQGWWMAVSLPVVILIPFAIFLNRRSIMEQRFKHLFFAVWIFPSIAFFILGHMGTMTYLQVYLGALCLWTAVLLTNRFDRSPHPRWLALATAGTVLVNLVFFCATRPFRASEGVRRTLDIVLMQFDGYSIHHNFGTSRRTGNTNTAEEFTGSDHDYVSAADDQALIDAARRNHFQYLPQ